MFSCRRVLPSLPIGLLLCVGWIGLAAPSSAQTVLTEGCLEDIAPFGVNCTANDVTFVLVGLGTQTNGCVQSGLGTCSISGASGCVTDSDCGVGGGICEYLDEVEIYLRAIVQNTTAQGRYDIGLWFSADGDERLCSSNVCSDMTTTCSTNSECLGIGDGLCDDHIRCDADADCASFGGTCEASDGAYRGQCGRSILGPAQRAYCSSDIGLTTPCQTDAQCAGADTCVVAGHCSATTSTTCLVDANCPGGESCVAPGCGPLDLDVNPPGDVLASGPYLAAEPGTSTGGGSPIDWCGDLFAGGISGCDENADGIWDDSVMDFTDTQTFPCADVDGDGFVNIPTCSTWGNNNSNVFLGTCTGGPDIGNYCTADSQCSGGANTCVDSFGVGPQLYQNACDSNYEVVPGTGAKCNCQNLNSNIPAPSVDLTCTCGDVSAGVAPGQTVACQVGFSNDSTCNPPVFECSGNGARCEVDGDCPPAQTCDIVAEEFQCGTARYVQFLTDDEFSNAMDAGGVFAATPGSPPSNATADYGSGDEIQIDPDAPIPNVISAQQSGTVNFTYTVDGGVMPGTSIDLITETLWANYGACSISGALCTQDADCPNPQTCNANFSNRCSATTSTTCTIDADCPGGETCVDLTQSLQAVCPLNISATWASVSDFEATRSGRDVVVEWRTDAEVGAIGFDLYRYDPESDTNIQVNRNRVAALHRTEGAAYTVIDRGAPWSETLTYTIIESDLQGARREIGPFEVTVKAAGIDHRSAPVAEFEGARAFAPSKRQARRAEAARREAMAFRQNGGDSRAQGYQAAAASVGAPGLYTVTAAELAESWQSHVKQVTRRIEQGRVEILNAGQSVSWLPAADLGAIYFYAPGLDSQFTTEDVYRIAVGSGALVDETSGKQPNPLDGSSFDDLVHYETDAIPAVVVAQDPESDYWYWDGIIAQSPDTIRTFSIDVHDPTGAGAAELSVLLFGATDDPLIGSEHHAVVRLNGIEIGSTIWDGVGDHSATFSIDPGNLLAGSNSVEIEAILGAGVSNSLFFIDSFDLLYSRFHRAVDDALHFTGDGDVISVAGFSTDSIRIFDITDARSPKLVVDTTIDTVGGDYRVSFAPGAPGNRYFAAGDSAVASVLALGAEIANTDLRTTRGAEYVLVAPAQLADAASALADYRSSTGYSTLVVSLEEIYSQFNDGVASPHAISDFVDYAYLNWQDRPRFLTLVGAASLDYRDLLGFGGNLVPTLMVPTPWGLFSSDLAFGDAVGDDGVPEVAVGRVPIFTAGELADYVAKVANYEANAGADWRGRALMMADDPDSSAGNFPLESAGVEAMLAPPLTAAHVDLSQQSISEARSTMFAELGAGVGFLNYVGHGSTVKLADEILMALPDVPNLGNEGLEPIMASATCIIGRFAVPGQESLAEALVVESNGGAAAVWAPSGLSFNDDAVLLNRNMARAAFSKPGVTLGEAVVEALRSYNAAGGYFHYMLSIFNVLGDPALAMQ